ncbi:MAG TPA: GntR family transcriptional regulator, partial [Herpetosiphonaceae bacterium]
IFTVMEGLELVATRTAAQRLTPADRHHLHELLAAMDQAVESAAHHQWADLNTAFHLAIVRMTDMPMLQEMTARVLDQWDRVRRYYLKDVLVFRLAQAQQEHHAIVQAMLDRDEERLAQVVRAHNQGALAAYTAYLANIAEPASGERRADT